MNDNENDKTFDVIGIGGVCWDFLGTVDEFAGRDEKMALNEFTQQGGGLAATAMVAVARLGGKPSIWGCISNDEFGRKNLDQFADEGVDTSQLKVVADRTSHFAFCVAQPGIGHRTIYWKHGDAGYLDEDDIDENAVLNCNCLLVDTHHLDASMRAAELANDAGIPIVLDMERPKADTRQLLNTVTHPILPEGYLHATGDVDGPIEAARRLHEKLESLIIITRGEDGAVAFDDGEMHVQPAFDVQPLVDTTGAGDVYHGAFAYGLTLGYGLETNMRFSAAVAALKCRALGGRTGIPTFEETWDFIESHDD